MTVRADYIKLLGPSGFSTEGVLASIPASGLCYVVCKAGPSVEKLDWVLQADKNHSYQFFRLLEVPSTLGTITLSGLLNTETFFIMGSTYTGTTATTTWSTGGISIATSMDACAGLLTKAINGGRVVTLASVEAADTVTIDGTVVTAHATTTTAADNEFAIDGATDALDAAQFVLACSGDGAIDGITVTQGAGTGEVLIAYTNDPDTYPTVTSSDGTRLAVSTIGQTYVSAAKTGTGVVTLKWRDSLVDRLIGQSPVFYTAGTGTAAAHAAFADTLLTNLQIEAAQVTGKTTNATSAGAVYTQTLNGAPFGVLAVTNADAGAVVVPRVSAYRIHWS